MSSYVRFLVVMCVTSCGDGERITSSIDDKASRDNAMEYCLTEVFAPKCLRNEVILLTSASYGRMKIGRCLQKESHQLHNQLGSDPLFLGCSIDVLPLLDRKCSGRNMCEITIPDADFQIEQPCHYGLTSYLESNYECVTVVDEDRSCVVPATFHPQHIMRYLSNKMNCGTVTQPWILQAPTGQQISVHLLDFSWTKSDAMAQESTCRQYGVILDKSIKRNATICGRGSDRNTLVYESSSNVLEVVLDSAQKKESNEEHVTFLLQFIAVGCSNLVPPEDAWLRRKENEAVIGCYSSHQTWTLRCFDNQWVGVIGNCTRGRVEDIEIRNVSELQSAIIDYQVVVIVSAVFIGLAICLVIICCGAVLYRRYVKMSKKYGGTREEAENCQQFPATVRDKEDIQCTLVRAA